MSGFSVFRLKRKQNVPNIGFLGEATNSQSPRACVTGLAHACHLIAWFLQFIYECRRQKLQHSTEKVKTYQQIITGFHEKNGPCSALFLRITHNYWTNKIFLKLTHILWNAFQLYLTVFMIQF